MNKGLRIAVVTGIAALTALLAGAVSADIIQEPGGFVPQVNQLVEDFGTPGIERPPVHPAAVAIPSDDGPLGLFEPYGAINWIALLEPTYRSPVADAEMRNVTCGYYPWICTDRRDGLERRLR